MSRADMVRLGEAIVWAFRDNWDEAKRPATYQGEIVRPMWDVNRHERVGDPEKSQDMGPS